MLESSFSKCFTLKRGVSIKRNQLLCHIFTISCLFSIFRIFIVLSSTLLHLLPLRFHSVVSKDAGIESITFATLPLAAGRSNLPWDPILFSIVSLRFAFLFHKLSFYCKNLYLVRCEGPNGVPEVLHQGAAWTAGAEGLQKCPAPDWKLRLRPRNHRKGIHKWDFCCSVGLWMHIGHKGYNNILNSREISSWRILRPLRIRILTYFWFVQLTLVFP